MKKITAIILASSMALSLTACGGSGSESATATTAAPETTAAAAEPEKAETEAAGTEAAETTAAASGTEVEVPASPLYYSLGSGSSGGNFYLVGGGISTVINNALPDYFVFTSEETGGSTANLTMLQNGDIELGISMTSSMAEAWEGSAEWTGGKMDKIRGVAPLYPSYLTIYTLADSGINTLDDITGHIIGLGSQGAAMDSIFREALPAMGIEPSSIFNDGHAATASALSDGNIDVALLFSYPPFAAITELEATKSLHFIGLTEEETDYLTSNYPFYSADTMPAGSYGGVTEDLPVISEWNMLVGTSEVSQDYGYLIAKALFENNPQLLAVHQSLMYCTPEYAGKFNIPLHAGTVQYLKEIGVEVPEELIPEEYTE